MKVKLNWYTDSYASDNTVYIYDQSKLVRKIFDDCIVYEYDGKPFLRLKK